MDLLVAGRMHEHMVLDRVRAPMGSPLDVVVVPPRYRGDLLVADRTDPLLLLPEQPQRPAAHQGPGHLHAQAFLEVRFPSRIVRVGLPCDLVVPLDRQAGGGEELDGLDDPSSPHDRPLEDPMSPADGAEVLVLDPSPGLLGVPPLGPLPQRPKDRVVHSRKGSLARHVAMIIGPSRGMASMRTEPTSPSPCPNGATWPWDSADSELGPAAWLDSL